MSIFNACNHRFKPVATARLRMADKRYHTILTPILALLAIFFVSCANGQQHEQNEAWLAAEQQAERTTVLLNNESRQVPLISLESLRIASVEMGFGYSAMFDSIAANYTRIDRFPAGPYLAEGSLNRLTDDLKLYNMLLVQLTDPSLADPRVLDFILDNEKRRQIVIVYFGDGGRVANLEQISSPVIWCRDVTSPAASFAAQAVFGGEAITGALDRDYGTKFCAGAGGFTTRIRLKYTVPEEVGINSGYLAGIDAIAAEAIRQHATPGAVVLVAKDGKVIFNKAYGGFTYDMLRTERATDIFDLASVTKITATTPVVMHLYETGQISLDDPLGKFLARTRNTTKENIKVKEVMLHQAGFTPYIPFYEKLKPSDHSSDSSAAYPTKVADNYYLRKNYYEEVMWPQMLNSKVVTRGQYVYSDLSMYFMKEIVEGVTHIPMNQYVQDEFYRPLGMQTAGFNPRYRFGRDQIVPTEEDTYFRKTLLQGYVHDQGAAMAGGVAGHAGNFASANDLAIYLQMLLNKGTYGGRQYFKPETVDLFTSRQSGVSRRGLGFDRWDPETSRHYPSEFASPETYGHTGYTGTCVWVDPAYGLVYIFLSNRVYPQVSGKLSSLNIRPRIHDTIYDAMKKSGIVPKQ
jgi:CubicO group peptidase (beta-lactamase class C family)